MDASKTRELAELRALLAKYGPASVLSAVGVLCADEAKQRSDDEEAEHWEIAADAAHDAAASLSGEDDEGDDDEAEDEDEGDEDEPEDDEDEGDEDDAPPSRGGEGEPPSAPAPRAVDGADDEETHDTRPQERRTTMATKDQRLGPRPEKATHWRCFRLVEGTTKWTPLFYGEDGIEVGEWPIRCCTADVIAERWGDGRFVVQYVWTDENGKRRPAGRSRTLIVTGHAPVAASSAAPPEDDGARAATPAAPPAMPAAPMPSHVAPPPAAATPSIDPWALITYIRETEERAQARAAAHARLEIERMHADTKEREARYRAELEAQMERERLASKERIAQMELHAKTFSRGARALDPELDAKLGQVIEKVSKVEERVEEALAGLEDEDDAPRTAMVAAGPPAPPDPFTTVVTALGPALAPVVEMLMTKFNGRPLAIPDIAPPTDPSKKPN